MSAELQESLGQRKLSFPFAKRHGFWCAAS
jgi:hypothetical protein